jgi:prepilin-type N-terminal cleavage/methylation domain-containing protein
VQQRIRQQPGFSLVETLVAMAIMLVTIGTFIQLFGVAAGANQRAARRSLASLAAMQKMEELRSESGSALVPSPAAVLQADVDGYCDRLPGGATRVAFTRRWSIEPLLSDPAHLLVLQVVVIGPGGGVEARIATLRRTGSA